MKVIRTLPLTFALVLVAVLAWAQAPDQAGEESVRPGINKRFLDPELKAADWVNRWEVESREVYAARAQVLKHCGIEKGMRVADIGAGTGLYTRLFCEAVGESGWVYAVDISPRFLEHVTNWARSEQVTNVTSVFCRDNDIALPPESIDLAFLCDTYHHFEYPKASNASILRALRKGGSLVVIDFERIPGKSREWVLGHVRAGKDVFRDELLAAGFVLEEEIEVEGFEENYFLRFRKK